MNSIEQDQTPYRGDEPQSEGVVPPPPQEPVHPVSEDYVSAQESAEASKQSELDEAREEHNRRTGGGKYPLSANS